jgi:hypothetical protein
MLRQLPDRNSNYPIASDCPTQLPDRNDCPAQLPDLGAANYLISISRLRSVGRQPPQLNGLAQLQLRAWAGTA